MSPADCAPLPICHSGACLGPAKLINFVGGVHRNPGYDVAPNGALFYSLDCFVISFLTMNPSKAQDATRTLVRRRHTGLEHTKFSSCGGVPRSGEVVFCLKASIYNYVLSCDHPVLRPRQWREICPPVIASVARQSSLIMLRSMPLCHSCAGRNRVFEITDIRLCTKFINYE